jgi:TorA maturation chaperone TorD
MSAQAAPARVEMHRTLPPEEQARADFYALLGRLLQAPPDASLLAALAGAGELPPEGDADLGKAWSALVAASSVMDAEAAREEYHDLFEGVGSGQVSIYSAFYIGAQAIDHPRVRLASDLAALGLAHRDEVTEPEDHWAGVFDVMRVLVAGGAGRSPATVTEQRRFFAQHLEPGVAKFFKAVQSARSANYYRLVAALGLAFTVLETESFRLD